MEFAVPSSISSVDRDVTANLHEEGTPAAEDNSSFQQHLGANLGGPPEATTSAAAPTHRVAFATDQHGAVESEANLESGKTPSRYSQARNLAADAKMENHPLLAKLPGARGVSKFLAATELRMKFGPTKNEVNRKLAIFNTASRRVEKPTEEDITRRAAERLDSRRRSLQVQGRDSDDEPRSNPQRHSTG
jgi:hypothetical protein